jgi:uncharacterized protein YndB with AHSA1/START domain
MTDMDVLMSDRTRIEKRVLIQASPATVFRALTEAKDLARWFCDHAVSDPREGGRLELCWKSGKTSQKGRALITRLEKDALLEMFWLEEGDRRAEEGKKHILAYKIQARKDSTEVLMTDQDDVPQSEEEIEILSQGWNNVLMELKDYCERSERTARSRSNPLPVKED